MRSSSRYSYEKFSIFLQYGAKTKFIIRPNSLLQHIRPIFSTSAVSVLFGIFGGRQGWSKYLKF